MAMCVLLTVNCLIVVFQPALQHRKYWCSECPPPLSKSLIAYMFEAAPNSRSHHFTGHMIIQEGIVDSPVGPGKGDVAIELLILPLPEDSLCDHMTVT